MPISHLVLCGWYCWQLYPHGSAGSYFLASTTSFFQVLVLNGHYMLIIFLCPPFTRCSWPLLSTKRGQFHYCSVAKGKLTNPVLFKIRLLPNFKSSLLSQPYEPLITFCVGVTLYSQNIVDPVQPPSNTRRLESGLDSVFSSLPPPSFVIVSLVRERMWICNI